MTSLTAAGNTYNPCLLVAENRGYTVSCETSGDYACWIATKDGVMLSGATPPEMLGIIGLWEAFGANWDQQHPNLLGDCLGKAWDAEHPEEGDHPQTDAD